MQAATTMRCRSKPKNEFPRDFNLFFSFDLQRIVVAACIHTKVVPHVRRAASQRYELARVVRIRDQVAWISESASKRTPLVRGDAAKTNDASLIEVICRPVTGEPVRALIPDVSHFHCHSGR